MKSPHALAAVLLAASALFSPAENSVPRGALSPAEELKTFQVADGLRVEIVAAEPMVESPCAMAFDEKGRLFVTENRGYPSTSEPPQGRVVMVESMKNDGYYDKRTVFAEGLTFPNGVMPWDGGLIVTSAPDIYFFKDTDGDGKADLKRVLLTGFEFAKSTQLRVNCPTIGPDGWIYFAAGLSAGTITSPEHPEKPAVKMTGDLRWNPKTGDFETVDGKSQYGIAFDDMGRRFICMNRLPVQHVVIESRWLRRNPHLAFGETVQDCNERTVKTGLKGGGDGVRLFPISRNITTADSHAGSFSAACSVRIWRGGALPEKFNGAAFSCDPTANLIHADRLIPRGATFAAESLLSGGDASSPKSSHGASPRELFASSDDWCRPVFLTRGPDGALYVCDMYRKTIEHPDYLPAEIRKHTDFEAGKMNGRIWRITSSAPVAKDMPRAWAYAKDRGLEREDLDKVPLEELLRGAESKDARVRFRAALGLGESRDARALQAMATIAVLGAEDRWTRAAVLSGVADREQEFVAAYLAQTKSIGIGGQELLHEAGRAFKDRDALGRTLMAAIPRPVGNDDWCPPAAASLMLAYSEATGKKLTVNSGDISLEPEIRCAEQNAVNSKFPAAERVLYVKLLGRIEDPESLRVLDKLATSECRRRNKSGKDAGTKVE